MKADKATNILHHIINTNSIQEYLSNNKGLATEALNEALLVAAIKGHSDVILHLADAGADVQTRDHRGLTALLHVVCQCDQDSVETLLRAGADPNDMCSSNGIHFGRGLMGDYVFRSDMCTAIMVAIYKRHFGIMRVLIENGATFNMVWDFYDLLAYMPTYIHKYTPEQLTELLMLVWHTEGTIGYNLIDHVVLKSDNDVLRRILNTQMLTAPNESLKTDCALMLESAVAMGDVEKVSLVLEYRTRHDLDLNVPCRDGYSPLMEACLECDTVIVEILLRHGADPDFQTSGYRNCTPLLTSLQTMNREKNAMHTLVCLIKNSSNLNIKCPIQVGTTGEVLVTALDYALMCYNLYGANALVLAGAKLYEPAYVTDNHITKRDPGLVHCTKEQRKEFVQENLHAPSSLKAMCRQAVRKTLRKDKQHSIDQLPLPAYIKGFLNYSDLEKMADDFKSEMIEFCDDSIPDLSNLTI
jgi:ankyrin repeat protein